MPVNQSRNSSIKSSVELMDLAASGAVAGLVAATVVETGAGCGGFVPGHVVVMAQFFFMPASFSLEGRPRMAGLGCLQCTNMSLPCGVEHLGGLAAK